jgi:hypothetical protein
MICELVDVFKNLSNFISSEFSMENTMIHGISSQEFTVFKMEEKTRIQGISSTDFMDQVRFAVKQEVAMIIKLQISLTIVISIFLAVVVNMLWIPDQKSVDIKVPICNCTCQIESIEKKEQIYTPPYESEEKLININIIFDKYTSPSLISFLQQNLPNLALNIADEPFDQLLENKQSIYVWHANSDKVEGMYNADLFKKIQKLSGKDYHIS